MFHTETKEPLGNTSLFHSSTWPAIEDVISKGANPRIKVRAIFREDLEKVCRQIGGPLQAALEMPETDLKRLSYHVETWVCSLKKQGLGLWNRQKV